MVDCQNYEMFTAGRPPTKLAFVSVANVTEYSSALSSCCGGNPISAWGPRDCFVYCNVTAPEQTHQSVADCVDSTLKSQDQGGAPVMHDEGISNAAAEKGLGANGLLGYVVMGIAFVGCVSGML